MRKNLFLPIYFSFFFLLTQIYAQDVAPRISGTVNSYAGVNTINKCDSQIGVTTTDDFTEGMTVLLIQMKGATINESNNDRFGEIESLRNVGRYEFNIIQSISGNNIFLFNNIINDYDVDGSVQIVAVPEYANVEVEELLTGEPWNGASGGIIALKVNGTLTMNADIDATALGFRGGKIDPLKILVKVELTMRIIITMNVVIGEVQKKAKGSPITFLIKNSVEVHKQMVAAEETIIILAVVAEPM